MLQLDQAHRILREKLEASQQRQMVQLNFYYDQLEQSLLSPEAPADRSGNNAGRAATLGRSSAGAAATIGQRKY